MPELLFLLLPIAAAYGWYMGQRSAKKNQEEISNKLSQDYIAGVNLLLSNQTEKAVDLFLNILQKQETENKIDSHSQFEAELTLGNLFRSRGEVDRALRIHQGIERSPHYSFEQKLLARQQLARDFMAVGFYDRAEHLYITLVDEPEFAENALQQLTVIYQKTKEWKKAINIAEKLVKLNGNENHVALAHYYCEYAAADTESAVEKQRLLQKALQVSPRCVRASMLLAEIAMAEQRDDQAIALLEGILSQNADYIGEVLDLLQTGYERLNQTDNFEFFLIRASQNMQNDAVELKLADIIEQKDGRIAAQSKLYQRLKHQPSTRLFHRFIQYQIDEAETGSGKDSLILLHNMVGESLKRGFGYRCSHCGYRLHSLLWNCPSCRRWETIKPSSGIEQH